MGLLPLETGGEGYHAPSPDDFNLPPLFPDVPWLAWKLATWPNSG